MSLSEQTRAKSVNQAKINMMKSLFHTKREWNYFDKSGNELYDVIAACCDYMNMQVASYQAVFSVYGDDFDVFDVARLSHFTARRLTLDDDFYQKRSVPFIAFTEDKNEPILCVPRGMNGIVAYNVQTGKYGIVDKKFAARLSKEAVMFYKPLPSRSLKLRDVFLYGIRRISKVDVINIVVMTLFSTLVGLLLPYLNEQLFDKFIPIELSEAITEIGCVILACSIGNLFFLLVKNLSMFRITISFQYTIVNATLERLYHLPQRFLEEFGSIDLVSRTMGISQALQVISNSFITAVLGFVFSLFYVARMATESSKLTVRALLVLLVTILITVVCGFVRIYYERKSLEEAYHSTNLLYQFVASIMKLRLSCVEDRALYEYQKHNVKSMDNSIRSAKANNIAQTVGKIMPLFFSGLLYYTVVSKDIGITIGQYAAFTSAFGMFQASIFQLVDFFLSIASAEPAFRRAMPIYKQQIEEDDSAGLIDKFNGKIEADHLIFSYDANERPVLNDISFTIEPGEYVAIVGTSGSGKSTLLKCLLGFETPNRGNIYYDDKDLDSIDKRELRRQMGVVLQDGNLIIGSIYENVAIASPHITAEEVMELLKEAGMAADIERMPMGIYTAVSEFGGTVSGGQKQRILIARSLANNPSIIIFDEATSALDNIAQEHLCETLEKRNATRLVIAHRLSTVEKCDRILVLNEGKISEQGTYEELMQLQGLFYKMAKRQMTE